MEVYRFIDPSPRLYTVTKAGDRKLFGELC